MNDKSIPKIIHYCWFGKNEKPEIVIKCIKSWEKVLYDYKIIEWNENNFDINSNIYVKQAYKNKMFAFVSDYVRIKVLYDYGGIYLDTDVEVLKKFDDLLENELFWGFEEGNYIATSTIGSKKKNKIISEFIDLYKDESLIDEYGRVIKTTNVSMITKLLESKGVKMNGKYQQVDGMTIYPREVFSPYDYSNCRNFMTKDTYCIHHFYKSWMSFPQRIKSSIKYNIAKIIGGDNLAKIRKIINN